jgi:hypothetical protein
MSIRILLMRIRFVNLVWAYPAGYIEIEFEIAKCDEGSRKAELTYWNPIMRSMEFKMYLADG